MSGPGNRSKLPENPTLKDINWYKKQINWGELPPFYHMVAQSLGESEGFLTHGFDNAIKRIIDKRNWNLQLLKGYIDNANVIHCENKPRLAIYQVFTDRGFELHALPYAKDSEIDQYVKGNRLMEFNLWDPMTMRMVLRINQLHKFISFYFEHGDEADFALILYSHKLVNAVIEFLQKHVQVTKIDGVSIRQYYDQQEKMLGQADADELQLSAIKAGITEPKNR
jgi:YD repeat-containing protein